MAAINQDIKDFLLKPLTDAQRKYLVTLSNAALQAQQQVNDFVAYLRDEHDAPAPEWELYDIQQGFVKKACQEAI